MTAYEKKIYDRTMTKDEYKEYMRDQRTKLSDGELDNLKDRIGNGGFENPTGVTYEGPMYRNVGSMPDGTPVNPLEMGEFTNNQNYRYTEPGVNGLYFASNQHITECEIGSYKTNPYSDSRTTYVYDNVKVDNMLDLINPTVKDELDVKLSDLLNDDYMNFYTNPSSKTTTHILGEYASDNGYNGIIAPSGY